MFFGLSSMFNIRSEFLSLKYDRHYPYRLHGALMSPPFTHLTPGFHLSCLSKGSEYAVLCLRPQEVLLAIWLAATTTQTWTFYAVAVVHLESCGMFEVAHSTQAIRVPFPALAIQTVQCYTPALCTVTVPSEHCLLSILTAPCWVC